MRKAPEIGLTSEEHAELTKLVRTRLSSVRLARRGVIQLSAQGMPIQAIARQLGIARVQVSRWRERYAESRLAGIERCDNRMSGLLIRPEKVSV